MVKTFSDCTCGYKFKPVKVMVSENGKKQWMVYCRFCHKEMVNIDFTKLTMTHNLRKIMKKPQMRLCRGFRTFIATMQASLDTCSSSRTE